MDKLIEKLSEYNILNYLIPGVLFLCFIDALEIHDINEKNVFLMLFGGYFSGMVLSRLGSIVVEPLFKWLNIVVYAPYSDYLKAEEKDAKLPRLVSENNMYRTFVAMFVLLIIMYLGSLSLSINGFLHSRLSIFLIILLLLVIYIFAFRKQTSYIRKRVEKINSRE